MELNFRCCSSLLGHSDIRVDMGLDARVGFAVGIGGSFDLLFVCRISTVSVSVPSTGWLYRDAFGVALRSTPRSL